MTHEIIIPENGLLDFEAFRKEAARKMKAGQPLTGESGILTPLIKRIVKTDCLSDQFLRLVERTSKSA